MATAGAAAAKGRYRRIPGRWFRRDGFSSAPGRPTRVAVVVVGVIVTALVDGVRARGTAELLGALVILAGYLLLRAFFAAGLSWKRLRAGLGK